MRLDAGPALDALPEPILILRVDGTVTYANKAAKSHVGDAAGAALASLTADHPDRLRAYLRRCSGSTEPVIGKIVLRGEGGRELPFRCHGSLIRPRTGADPTRILVRFLGPPEERFSAVTRQLEDLHAEIRKRRRIQVILEEALRERDLLMRELNHRVRNNLQMLLSMLSAARVGAHSTETQVVLDRACRRVAAIGSAQQVLYGAGLQSVTTTDFVSEVCRTIVRTLGARPELVLDLDRAELSNDLAAPVALVLNELITNAVKHGFADNRTGRIEVTLRTHADEFELTVADNGVGFDGAQIREGASGLGLVHGLTRSLGGSVTVLRDQGTRCILRFRDRHGAGAIHMEGSRHAERSHRQERGGSDINVAAIHAAPGAGVGGRRPRRQSATKAPPADR